MIPSRFIEKNSVRKRHGSRVDRYASFLTRSDPLADAVVADFSTMSSAEHRKMLSRVLDHGIQSVEDAPESLIALFAQLDSIPVWADPDLLKKGGATFLRTGLFGVYVLMCYSLPVAYCSPGGNKPLIFSGRLKEMAPRRLSETGRFVLETSLPGGLNRFSEGFKITVKVRLMHAEVRRQLLESGKWDSGVWGTPINQADMVGTSLLFSAMALDGLRKFGFRFSPSESEAVMHLWRYSGYLMGVDPELLPATEKEALRIWDVILNTQGPPDQDSVELAQALMESPKLGLKTSGQDARAVLLTKLNYGISRALVGDEFAEGLQYPKSAWRFSIHALRPVVSRVENFRKAMPLGSAVALSVGTATWRKLIENGLDGIAATFDLPKGIF